MPKITHNRYELDATGQAPGRLATQVATLLMGKHKATYTPHIDDGSKVLILNADKIVLTGKKIDQKLYRHHSMHPGGLKETPMKQVLKESPKDVILHAVIKMLPKNKLRNDRMKRIMFK